MTQLAIHSPTKRRMQMLVMVFHLIGIPFCTTIFFLCCALPPLWPVVILYLLFMVFDPRPSQGTVLSPVQTYCRKTWWWRQFAEYFPIVLHKTVDLEPAFEVEPVPPKPQVGSSIAYMVKTWWRLLLWWYYVFIARSSKPAKATGKRYIFGYHPHGIIGMGALAGMCAEGAGWPNLFPGIPVRTLTLTSNFYIPVYREYLLSVGMAMVSKISCMRLLRNNNPICIVVGGARESLMAHPKSMDLVLESRYGFIKIALQTGASLVPVVAFGENDIFMQAQSEGIAGSLHKFMSRHLGFVIPLFHARGIFNYDLGLLPFRRPIHIVVGAPVEVPLKEKPTQEDIQLYHKKYVDALKALYEDNKTKYAPEYRDVPMNIKP